MVRVLDSQGERSQKKEPAFQGKTERRGMRGGAEGQGGLERGGDGGGRSKRRRRIKGS